MCVRCDLWYNSGSWVPSHTREKGGVSQRLLERIQDAIVRREYDLTRHAADEMAENRLDILDVECTILEGKITKTETNDPRGPRFTVVGPARDGRTEVGVVGRFTETGAYLVVTVYEVTSLEA